MLRIEKDPNDEIFLKFYDFEDYLYESWREKDLEEADGESSAKEEFV